MTDARPAHRLRPLGVVGGVLLVVALGRTCRDHRTAAPLPPHALIVERAEPGSPRAVPWTPGEAVRLRLQPRAPFTGPSDVVVFLDGPSGRGALPGQVTMASGGGLGWRFVVPRHRPGTPDDRLRVVVGRPGTLPSTVEEARVDPRMQAVQVEPVTPSSR